MPRDQTARVVDHLVRGYLDLHMEVTRVLRSEIETIWNTSFFSFRSKTRSKETRDGYSPVASRSFDIHNPALMVRVPQSFEQRNPAKRQEK